MLAVQGWHHDSFAMAAELLRRSRALDPGFVLAPASLSLVLGLGERIGLAADSGIKAEALEAAGSRPESLLRHLEASGQTERASLAAEQARSQAGFVVLESDRERMPVDHLDHVVCTGYGRLKVPFAQENVSEISCHARGAHWMAPGTRTVVDIGGQDCKVISVSEKGTVLNFAMNDRCAAGTGRFFEAMARALSLQNSPIRQNTADATLRGRAMSRWVDALRVPSSARRPSTTRPT